MGCGGSTEVSSATAVAVEDATTSCVSDTPLVEDIAIDYDLDGEEMDLVELVSEATSTVSCWISLNVAWLHRARAHT